jgi:hypothetical protein
MDMRNEIKKLARLEEAPYPFFSLYLNTKWDDEQQRERIRLFTKNQLKKALDSFRDREDWRNALIKDQQQIERYVEGLVRRVYEEMNGMAIFSCSGSGTFFTYPSIISFENECFISDVPILRPLVQLSSQYENTLFVMVDTDSSRLFEVSLEGLMDFSEERSKVLRRVFERLLQNEKEEVNHQIQALKERTPRGSQCGAGSYALPPDIVYASRREVPSMWFSPADPSNRSFIQHPLSPWQGGGNDH